MSVSTYFRVLLFLFFNIIVFSYFHIYLHMSGYYEMSFFSIQLFLLLFLFLQSIPK